MGSGKRRKDPCSETRGGSQPYAETYHVVCDMLRKDKKDTDIYHPVTGYFHNPSAILLREAIRGNKIYQRNGVAAQGEFMYVMDTSGPI